MKGSETRPLDLFVVGGGINGAGIACDALHVSPEGSAPANARVLPVASSTHGGFDNDKGTQQQVIAFIKR